MIKLSDEFIKKVSLILQEEEISIYVLTLYYLNHEDLSFFRERDRVRVKRIFEILIRETKHHAELLKLIVAMGET